MSTLGELASLIRSKNAGPFTLTIDIMFSTVADYNKVRLSNNLNPAVISGIFNVALSDIQYFTVDNALAIKISIPRPVIQGDIGDTDSHGGQQYAPLVDLTID